MHMKCSYSAGSIAVPLFGLNAPPKRGSLMVTSRKGSTSAQVGILPFAPDGQIQADQSISSPTNADEIALVVSVMTEESGFIFDGVLLSDVAYLYVESAGAGVIDVSFLENRMPVDVGKTGGWL